MNTRNAPHLPHPQSSAPARLLGSMATELAVIAQAGIPDDAIFSVRAGPVRKQAAVNAGKPYRFPKLTIAESPIKIDILQPIGTAYIVVKPGHGSYQAIFQGKHAEGMSCEVEIRAPEGEEAADKEPEAAENAQAAKDAKAYLESHSVLSFVQAVLQTVIKERPADPFAHIARHFACGYDPATSIPAATRTGGGLMLPGQPRAVRKEGAAPDATLPGIAPTLPSPMEQTRELVQMNKTALAPTAEATPVVEKTPKAAASAFEAPLVTAPASLSPVATGPALATPALADLARAGPAATDQGNDAPATSLAIDSAAAVAASPSMTAGPAPATPEVADAATATLAGNDDHAVDAHATPAAVEPAPATPGLAGCAPSTPPAAAAPVVAEPTPLALAAVDTAMPEGMQHRCAIPDSATRAGPVATELDTATPRIADPAPPTPVASNPPKPASVAADLVPPSPAVADAAPATPVAAAHGPTTPSAGDPTPATPASVGHPPATPVDADPVSATPMTADRAPATSVAVDPAPAVPEGVDLAPGTPPASYATPATPVADPVLATPAPVNLPATEEEGTEELPSESIVVGLEPVQALRTQMKATLETALSDGSLFAKLTTLATSLPAPESALAEAGVAAEVDEASLRQQEVVEAVPSQSLADGGAPSAQEEAIDTLAQESVEGRVPSKMSQAAARGEVQAESCSGGDAVAAAQQGPADAPAQGCVDEAEAAEAAPAEASFDADGSSAQQEAIGTLARESVEGRLPGRMSQAEAPEEAQAEASPDGDAAAAVQPGLADTSGQECEMVPRDLDMVEAAETAPAEASAEGRESSAQQEAVKALAEESVEGRVPSKMSLAEGSRLLPESTGDTPAAEVDVQES